MTSLERIQDIPTKLITRGIIMSMMDTDYPVVECFTNGSKVVPVACLNGLPFPFDRFIFHFCNRFSPGETQRLAPWEFKKDPTVVYDPETDELMKFWGTLDIPENARNFIANYKERGSESVMIEQISLLYERHCKKENPQESFLKMVNEVDRVYGNSFNQPVTI